MELISILNISVLHSEISIHTSPPSLFTPPQRLWAASFLSPFPIHNLHSLCPSKCTISLSPQLTQTTHLAWAVPFQSPFSIPDLHTHSHTLCPLGGSLPASILHFRSPLTRTLPLGRFPSSLHSPFPIYHSSHPTLWAVPFQPPFSILRSPIWSLVPDDGARATTFAEAQR